MSVSMPLQMHGDMQGIRDRVQYRPEHLNGRHNWHGFDIPLLGSRRNRDRRQRHCTTCAKSERKTCGASVGNRTEGNQIQPIGTAGFRSTSVRCDTSSHSERNQSWPSLVGARCHSPLHGSTSCRPPLPCAGPRRRSSPGGSGCWAPNRSCSLERLCGR